MRTTAVNRRPPSRATDLVAFLFFAAVVAVTALIGGLAAGDAGAEYATLDRPGWAPPAWLFGPVWTALYAMIAVAGWLAWRSGGPGRVFVPYAAQLVLNASWTLIFFGASAYGLASTEIIVLWCAIAATVVAFWRVGRGAALLMLPYLAWTGFAAVLNLTIWWMNR